MSQIYTSKGMSKVTIVSGILLGVFCMLMGIALVEVVQGDKNESIMNIFALLTVVVGLIYFCSVVIKSKTKCIIFDDHIECKAISSILGLSIGNLTDFNLKVDELKTISSNKMGLYIHTENEKFFVATSDGNELMNQINALKRNKVEIE